MALHSAVKPGGDSFAAVAIPCFQALRPSAARPLLLFSASSGMLCMTLADSPKDFRVSRILPIATNRMGKSRSVPLANRLATTRPSVT